MITFFEETTSNYSDANEEPVERNVSNRKET